MYRYRVPMMESFKWLKNWPPEATKKFIAANMPRFYNLKSDIDSRLWVDSGLGRCEARSEQREQWFP